MEKESTIKLFEQKQIRTHWDNEEEKWYFSVVDVVSVLTDSADGRKYWNKLTELYSQFLRKRQNHLSCG